MTPVRCTASALGLLASVLLLVACGPTLEPLPAPPDLADADESVRRQYEQLRGDLDGLPADADDGERAAAHGRLGLWFHAYRQAEAAELAYSNALALEPRSQRWSYLRALLLVQAGRMAEAARDFAVAAESGQPAAVVRLAETEIELGEWTEALARLEPIVAGDERNVRARAVLARGLLARAESGAPSAEADRRAAAALLEEALRVQADATGLRYQLAGLYRELGETGRAAAHLARLQADDGDGDGAPLRMVDPWGRELEETDISYLGLVRRGRRAAAGDRHLEALRLFDRAQAVDPERFAAPFAAARSLLALGRDREARERGLELLERFSDRSETHLLLGRLYQRDADPRAADAFARAVELDPRSLPALRHLAAARYRAGDLDSARELLERARESAPGSTQVLLPLADVLVDLGRRDEAVELLESALSGADEPWALELRLERLRSAG